MISVNRDKFMLLPIPFNIYWQTGGKRGTVHIPSA